MESVVAFENTFENTVMAFAKYGQDRDIRVVSTLAQHFQLDEVIAECNGVIKRVESTQSHQLA